jgi:hypothetical protein
MGHASQRNENGSHKSVAAAAATSMKRLTWGETWTPRFNLRVAAMTSTQWSGSRTVGSRTLANLLEEHQEELRAAYMAATQINMGARERRATRSRRGGNGVTDDM